MQGGGEVSNDKHECTEKERWGQFTAKCEQYDKHLADSDGRGGYRDRVADLERSNKLMPYVCAGCAFCGGLCAQIAPELCNAIAHFIGLLH